jgi:uncharacterized protein (TIGR02996 family)
MLNSEVFLKVIRANYLDDAPWLIYSDWLYEQGDPRWALFRQPRLTNSIGMRFQLILPGTFLMGSPKDEEGRSRNEDPQHQVDITKPFYLGVNPVTQGQWQRIMRRNPSYFSTTLKRHGDYIFFKGKDWTTHPVEQVSWEDVVAFCENLSELPKEKWAARVYYRLPSEAEWEYSCRGGASHYQTFAFGNALTSDQVNCSWNVEFTSFVGSYQSNGFGLHDMHGNVWEWCADFYDANYYRNSPREDPQGPSQGSQRVLRGGSWCDGPHACRSASRNSENPDYRSSNVGCRLVLVPSGGRWEDHIALS